jgi:hypothetical protein
LALKIGLGDWNHSENTDRAGKAIGEIIVTKNTSTRLLPTSCTFIKHLTCLTKNPSRKHGENKENSSLDLVAQEED